VDATIYYGTNTSAVGPTIDGLKVGDTNLFYIKVVDLANSESAPDTSTAIYVHPKTSELLVIAGEGELVQNEYKRAVNATYGTHDFLDYESNSGENQPKYWSPTFELLIANYDILLQFGNGTTFTNDITGQRDILLGFSAPFIQNYSTNGGKSFIVNSFTSNNDVSNIATVMPFDSLSSSSGQAVIQVDSAMVPVYNPSNYPTMNPVSILLGMDPFYPTADATIMYEGQLESFGDWTGPNTLAAGRINGSNQLFQVFFTAPLHQFGTEAERDELFNQILNNDFNW
jgi:hypothetical protein